MKSMEDLTLNAIDDHLIPLYKWQQTPPAHPPKGVVHISHGMAEHGRRYHRVAEALNQSGYLVYAHDHRGHGQTIKHTGLGFFAHQRGWRKVVDDVDIVVHHLQKQHPTLPLILLGHSMGSYILQTYLSRYPSTELAGAVLSGSSFAPDMLLWAGQLVARLECVRQGRFGHSPIIQQLTFNSYNRTFKPNRTEFDWLSRDEQQVDAFIEDPLCGFPCSNRLWLDLFRGMLEIKQPQTLAGINTNLPLLVMGGEKDPISAPKGLQKLAKALQKAGVKDVTLSLYPDGRHEMLNEINAEQVTARLIQWTDQCILKLSKQPDA